MRDHVYHPFSRNSHSKSQARSNEDLARIKIDIARIAYMSNADVRQESTEWNEEQDESPGSQVTR